MDSDAGGESASGSGEGTTVSVDEFRALEEKVLQAVERIRRERDARAVVEADCTSARAENAVLHERLAALEEANSTARTELGEFHREREALRGRVERMLAQIDELL